MTLIKRRRRARASLGTCQICGKTIAIAASLSTPVIRVHGYEKQRGERVPCYGSGEQPLEHSKDCARRALIYYGGQVTELKARAEAIRSGTAPPPGLRGINALKARMNSDQGLEDAQRLTDMLAIETQIAQMAAKVDMLDRLLLTEASGTLKSSRAVHARIGDIIRRGCDGKVYEILDIEPGIPILGRRKPSDTFICAAIDGVKKRLTAHEVTRALREIGQSLKREALLK